MAADSPHVFYPFSMRAELELDGQGRRRFLSDGKDREGGHARTPGMFVLTMAFEATDFGDRFELCLH